MLETEDKREKRLFKYYGLAWLSFLLIVAGILFAILLSIDDLGNAKLSLFENIYFMQLLMVVFFPYFYVHTAFMLSVFGIAKYTKISITKYIHIADIGFTLSVVLFIYWTFFHEVEIGS